jgi:hypothetical protein
MMRGASGFPFSGGGIGLKAAGILAQSAVPSSVTGTTTETVLATINIPAGAVGPNGYVRITADWSLTSNADTKNFRMRLGGNTIGSSYTLNAAQSTFFSDAAVYNQNSQSSQYTRFRGNTGGQYNVSTGSLTANMATAQSLTLTAQLGTSTDTVTLLSYTVEILNP